MKSILNNYGGFVKGPLLVTPAQAGVQDILKKLDSGSRIETFQGRPRRNDVP